MSSSILPQLKQCSKCKQIKIFDEFGSDKRMSNGLKSWCKECLRKDARNRARKNSNRHIDEIEIPTNKRCIKCEEVKEIEKFYRRSAYCKNCHNKYTVKRQKEFANRRLDEIEFPYKKYCSKCRVIKNRNNFSLNKRAKDGLQSKCKACASKHSKANPEKRREHNQRRLAKKKEQKFIDWPSLPEMIKKHNGRCAGCGKTENKILRHPGGYKWTIDHIIPVSKGGIWARNNAQLMCHKCNSRKNSKLPAQWAQENGRLL